MKHLKLFICGVVVVMAASALVVLISKYAEIVQFLNEIRDEEGAEVLAFNAGIEYCAGMVAMLFCMIAFMAVMRRDILGNRPTSIDTNSKNDGQQDEHC